MKTSLDFLKQAGLLVCFLFSYGLTIQAQHWALPSSQWQYVTSGCGQPGPCYEYYSDHYIVAGDTVILGHTCAHVINTMASSAHSFYTYSSGDTAYFLLGAIFRPTFYFAAHVGDTLRFYAEQDTFSSLYVVDSTSYLISGTDTLRECLVYPLEGGAAFSYAERIGLLHSFVSPFYPQLSSIVDADDIYPCNYGDSAISTFWVYPSRSCTTVGIQEISSGYSLGARPNPTDKDITVVYTMLHSQELDIYLTDMTGRTVMSLSSGTQAAGDHQVQADLSTLAGGVYMVTFHSGEGTAVRKIVKE